MKKAFWQSKTLLFNALGAAAAILPQLEASLPALAAMLPAHYYATLSAIVIAGNVVLRCVTDTAVALKQQQPVIR